MLRDSFTDVRAPSSSIREGEREGGGRMGCVVVVVVVEGGRKRAGWMLLLIHVDVN